MGLPVEVGGAGHDCCIIPIQPKQFYAWRKPDPERRSPAPNSRREGPSVRQTIDGGLIAVSLRRRRRQLRQQHERIKAHLCSLCCIVGRGAVAPQHAAHHSGQRPIASKLAPDWHQPLPENKKSAGANLLTLAYLGSPTWARTRDLRINSRTGPAYSCL